MLEDYIKKQPIITKLLIKSINNNKLVQAYLFVSNDKIFLMEYALAFTKKIVSDDISIHKMIDNGTYPELKIINPQNNIIKKEELIKLQKDFYVKPTIGNKMVYIINEADKLNSSSANTILKFLEEPNDDVVAILLTDNLAKILPTIKSRCQVMNLQNNNTIDISELNQRYFSSEQLSIEDFIKKMKNVISFIKTIENKKLNSITNYKDSTFDMFKTKEDYIFLFDFVLYFYYDILNYKLKRNLVYYKEFQDEISNVSNNNELVIIQNKLKIIENTRLKLNSNMNLKLLLDEFIILFSEV